MGTFENKKKSFIESAIMNKNSSNHEYEDVIVQGQIIDAKEVIQSAINYNKNSVIWCYEYDSYDSYTRRIDNIFPNGVYADRLSSYKTSTSTAGGCHVAGSINSYLYRLVLHNKPGGPITPAVFDYVYVENRIEIELRNLGCKKVELFIGPKTVTESKLVSGKRSLLTGKYKYQHQDVTLEVIKWWISVAW